MRLTALFAIAAMIRVCGKSHGGADIESRKGTRLESMSAKLRAGDAESGKGPSNNSGPANTESTLISENLKNRVDVLHVLARQ